MATHGLSSALTLYDARTLSLSQAAAQAGLSESEFLAQIDRHGIEVWDRDRTDSVRSEPMVTAD